MDERPISKTINKAAHEEAPRKTPVSLKVEDLRYVFMLLKREVQGIYQELQNEFSDESERTEEKTNAALELALDEIRNIFESARWSLLIDGRRIDDGIEFRNTCEDNSGEEPFDEELANAVRDILLEITDEAQQITRFRREMPQNFYYHFDTHTRNLETILDHETVDQSDHDSGALSQGGCNDEISQLLGDMQNIHEIVVALQSSLPTTLNVLSSIGKMRGYRKTE